MIAALLLYLVPLWGLVVLFRLWARHSRVPPLARLLRLTTVIAGPGLTATLALAVLVHETCGGNLIYGYRDCRLVSVPVATLVVRVLLVATLVAGLVGAGLALIGGFAEWRARAAARRG